MWIELADKFRELEKVKQVGQLREVGQFGVLELLDELRVVTEVQMPVKVDQFDGLREEGQPRVLG